MTTAFLLGAFGVVACGADSADQDEPRPEPPLADGGADHRDASVDEGDGGVPDAGDPDAPDASDGGAPEAGDADSDAQPDGDAAADTDGAADSGHDGSLPDPWGDDHEPVSPAASMAAKRADHAAVRLADGRVIVMGGREGGSAGPIVEAFDPNTDTWSAPDLTNAPTHPGNVAYLLSSGEVAVTQTDLSTSVHFYDPETGAFRAGASPAHSTTAPFSVLLPSGRAYTAGGYTTGGTTVLSARFYNPETDEWKSSELREPRRGASAVPLDDRHALIAGGRHGLRDLYSAEIVDTTTGESLYTGSPRQWFDGSEIVLLDGGDLLMAGGADFDRNPQSQAERFSIDTGRWSLVEPMVVARQDFTLTKIGDGRVLAIGGRVQESSSVSKALASIEIYDPAKDEWRRVGELETPRYLHRATLLQDGRVLVTGGMGALGYLGSAEIIDIANSCANDESCGCEPESDEALCARYESTCAKSTLEDRCGSSREVSCQASVCSTTEVCESGPGGSSRCIEKPTAGSRFHVEKFSSSNELQAPLGVGVDLEGLPIVIEQGTAIGEPAAKQATALNLRLPSGRWVRQGLTRSNPSISTFFAEGQAPHALASPTEGVSLYHRWVKNVWETRRVSGLATPAGLGRKLLVDGSGHASLARAERWSASGYWLRFTELGDPVASVNVEYVNGNGFIVDAALDASGEPHIVYVDSEDGLKYATRDEGVWLTEVVDADSRGSARIFIDKDGPRVVYREGNDTHDIRHARPGATGWVIESWPLPSGISAPVFAMGKDGKVRAAFRQEGAVNYAIREASGWATEPVFTPAGTGGISVNALELTREDKPLIVMRLGQIRYFATIW